MNKCCTDELVRGRSLDTCYFVCQTCGRKWGCDGYVWTLQKAFNKPYEDVVELIKAECEKAINEDCTRLAERILALANTHAEVLRGK
jgi:hypothetical protein